MSSKESVSTYKFEKGIILELYKQNLINEQEKNMSLDILMKKHSMKGEKKNE